MTQTVNQVTHGSPKHAVDKAAPAQGAESAGLDLFQDLLTAQLDVQATEGLVTLGQDDAEAESGKTLPQSDATGGNVLPQAALLGGQLAMALADVRPDKAGKGDISAAEKSKGPRPERLADVGAEMADVRQDNSAQRDDFSNMLLQQAAAQKAGDALPVEIARSDHAIALTQATPVPVAPLNPNIPYTALPTSPAAVAEINSPLGAPAWGQELQQKVAWMVDGQQQRVNIQLNPPHLGPLEIQLQINNDQATVIFATPHSAVKEAVEAAMPRLQQSFEQQGIKAHSLQCWIDF